MNKKSARRLSLTNKLMGLYTLATMALMVALSLMLYPTFHTLISQLTSQNLTQVTIDCYKQFILTFLLGGIGALILGNWIAKQGLSKIQELQKNMELISAQALDKRIEIEAWPQELKPLGACFNAMLDRLETAFNQLNQFSADIAHELRHPIHNLKQITELALSKPNLPDEYQNHLSAYMQEFTHLSKLIEQLLFLARSDSSQIKLEKKRVNLAPLIEKLFEFYTPLAEEKSCKLQYQGDALLDADDTLFQRMISNLLHNAITYAYPETKIEVQIEQKNNTVEIQIKDQGKGIEAQHLPQLCNRLYRVDEARASQEGLGLGLAIVHSIVKLHKGEIHFKSHLKTGTIVSLTFPL